MSVFQQPWRDAMPKERVTRRQKDVSRLLREKNKIQKDSIKKIKKKRNA
jgi:hypothetical protein